MRHKIKLSSPSGVMTERRELPNGKVFFVSSVEVGHDPLPTPEQTSIEFLHSAGIDPQAVNCSTFLNGNVVEMESAAGAAIENIVNLKND